MQHALPCCLSPPPRSTKVDGRHDAVSQGTDPEQIGLWHRWRSHHPNLRQKDTPPEK